MATRKMLDTICEGECEPHKYCILKEIILASQSNRVLSQLKCVEVHKYLVSKKANREYSWQEAMTDWVDSRKAEYFAQVYDEELSAIEIYKRIETLESKL